MKDVLEDKDFRPSVLKDFLLELIWENRDIRPSHLKFFRGAVVIPDKEWNRSTELDNILGYYDPDDRYIKLHEDLLGNPSRLREDFLVALGESLLGRYIEKRRWTEQHGARCYEIVLRAASARQCFLTDSQLGSVSPDGPYDSGPNGCPDLQDHDQPGRRIPAARPAVRTPVFLVPVRQRIYHGI